MITSYKQKALTAGKEFSFDDDLLAMYLSYDMAVDDSVLVTSTSARRMTLASNTT